MIIFEDVLAITVFLAILLIVPVLFVGPDVLLYVRSMRRARGRQLQVKQFADATGWLFVARDDRQAPSGRPPFDLPNPRAVNVISGSLNGRQIVAMQYAMQNATPSDGLAVCVMPLPAILPYLEVGPRSVAALADMPIGTRDIEIESEDFNRRFTVWADDPRYAYDVVSPRLAGKLLASGPYRWRLEGDRLLSWTTGPIDTSTLAPWMAILVDIVDSIPEFVWHDHGPALPPVGR